MDSLRDKLEHLKTLNKHRFDYVIARSRMPTILGACKEIGMSQSWYYNFNEEERELMETLADELKYERVHQAELELQQAALEAAQVIRSSLKERDKRLRLDAARDILDRTGVKAPTKTEVKQSGDVTIRVIYDE